MAGERGSLNPQPSGPPLRGLIVVARDQPYLWQSLQTHFAANADVELVLDRRLWERRQRVQRCAPERREADRRRPVSLENDLRHRSFLIVAKAQAACQG